MLSFTGQPQILRYPSRCADRFGIRPHLPLGTAIEQARWDEARQRWTPPLSSGETVHVRVLISAVGGLSRPLVPELPGLETFRGERFHSQQWDHGEDLHGGRRVAVVGTGIDVRAPPGPVPVGEAREV